MELNHTSGRRHGYGVDDGLSVYYGVMLLHHSSLRQTKAHLVGHAALEDTMVDLILDFVGSVAIGVLGYFEIKKREKSPQQPKV